MGAASWDALASAAPMASPFTSWAWYRAWSDAVEAETRDDAFVLELRDGSGSCEPQALLPLALRDVPFRRATARALTWATGRDGSPDHLDIPAQPEARIEALVPTLAALDWDVILLTDVAEDAPGVDRLVSAFERRGFPACRLQAHCCPYLDLPSDWDAYLGTLSSSRRQAIRRRERKLIREHSATFTDYTGETFEEGWRRFLALHKCLWTGADGFQPRSEAIVRRFLEELDASDSLWLASLDLHGEPAASWCGFTWKDTLYFYMCGREPRWDAQGVGQALMARMIRCAIERGIRRFDFMKGEESYKWSWTSTSRHTYERIVFRPGLRGTWFRGLEAARKVRARMRAMRALAHTSEPGQRGVPAAGEDS